jgi:hypothetical protein
MSLICRILKNCNSSAAFKATDEGQKKAHPIVSDGLLSLSKVGFILLPRKRSQR